MVLKPRKPLPDVGEILVATIEDIKDYGAYVRLDEYGGLQAFLPWSEIEARMLRRFRHLYHPGNKIVVKVTRVNRKRGYVDVSLKKVLEGEKRRKMIWWKRQTKAVTLIELVAKKLGKSVDEAYEKVIWPLEDYYGDLMTALEYASLEGAEALKNAGIPEEWIEPIVETAKKHVKVSHIKISGLMTIQSFAPDGIERIRNLLIKMRESIEKGGDRITAKIYTIGAPRYRIDVIGYDYKEMEKALSKGLKVVKKEAPKRNITFEFERLKT